MVFPPDPPVSKRQLGVLIALAGLAAGGAVLLADRLGAGSWQGLGPAQAQALGAAGLLLALGLSLWPLGGRPA